MFSGTRYTGQSSSLTVNALYDDPWRTLWLYSLYRLILAVALIFIGFSELSPLSIEYYDKQLFVISIALYFFLALSGNLSAYLQWPSYETQIYLNTLIDVIILLKLVYSGGGMLSGMASLIAIPLLVLNLARPGQTSLLMSAISIIFLIVLESFLVAEDVSSGREMLQVGLLSLFILISSWLGGSWVTRATQTAALAKRRGVDIANLSELNQAILDELNSGILVLDKNGIIRQINSSAWEMLGKPEKLRQRSLEQYAPELNKHLEVWRANVCPRIISCDIKHQDTTELRVRFAQLGRHSGENTVIYLEDTSEQRERIQESKLASLGQLTANIAHEIRNPLGAISHSAQLLSESERVDKMDRKMVEIIQRNTKRMNRTIQNVLNISRKKKPSRRSIHLKPWLQDFIDDFVTHEKLQKEQIRLLITQKHCTAEFDPDHLHQVLWNLCRNAVKYAHDNPNHLILNIQAGTPKHSRNVVLNVVDNGSGISKENQTKLFEPFHTTSESGTGLGLYMSRELCMNNGSSLDYIHMPSGGSCFRLVFSQKSER